ncbi:phospholipase/carboxylesterase [Paenibacillus cellulosilyticus]|uniref:Phospholipase/carboxylesterase n=1 Tax=Paenibacillus cellulosilyticus TaxID=375489 RepID=A0A2V2YQC3_9BACL|nr:alpha/beta hydrolase [Paenibacillus cellulosilyticus]PWV98667.1 phospholipase/carboxylesterase [Paenibacillus cellulosilyticus]QKS43825.1 alpha/beta hydrolase [Paenibacillus cellulosilyticus]
MKHIFKQGSDSKAPVLVMFHGTGGTEQDLLGLAELISPTSSILSVRGNVLENGMPRFFRRIAEGVFDEEDLVFRTTELYDFLDQAAADYGLDRSNFVAVGYSNGANIAGSLLFHYARSLRGAILHHPMVPRRGVKLPDLAGVPIFIGAGENDPICSPVETEELEELFDKAGALVDVHWERAGHRLTQTEAEAAAQWFKLNFVK